MSNNLQEINNLSEALARHPSRIIQIGHNCYEQHDADTIKQLCVSCGGKGFYLLCTLGNHKGVLVACGECEDGFKYSKMLEQDYGPSK